MCWAFERTTLLRGKEQANLQVLHNVQQIIVEKNKMYIPRKGKSKIGLGYVIKGGIRNRVNDKEFKR